MAKIVKTVAIDAPVDEVFGHAEEPANVKARMEARGRNPGSGWECLLMPTPAVGAVHEPPPRAIRYRPARLWRAS